MKQVRNAARALGLTLVLALLLAAGACGGRAVSSDPVLVSPEQTGKASGGTDDIYDAVQDMLRSLMSSTRVRAEPGNRIVLYKIENSTGIPEYDERIIYNRFLSDLTGAAADRFVFLERRGDEVPPHDMDLTIELLQIPAARTKTIQYNFRIVNLKNEIIWTHSKEIKKRL